jgi:hypothetical protein
MLKIIFSLALVSAFCFGQKLPVTILQNYSISCDNYLGFDTIGDYYFVKDNVLTKVSNDQKWQYKNVAFGKITSVDLLNPLQLVVFYESYNTVILLDNQLNEIQKIDFNQINSVVASKVARSGKNKLWIFNSINQKLGLFDVIKNTVNEFPIPVQGMIKFSQSDFNYFYWIDNTNNWYSCSIYGKTEFLATIPSYEKIQIIDNERVLFSVKNRIYLLNPIKNTTIELDIVENSFKNFYYRDQNLAIFTDQQITNYKIILP